LGYAHEEAYNNPGEYGGDDSITANLPNSIFEVMCMRFGQKAKSCYVQRGSIGVNFLSRFYSPGVWNGETDSICDIPRQLTKWHLTTNLSPNNAQTQLTRAVEKAISANLMDAHTPIISELTTAVIERALVFSPQSYTAITTSLKTNTNFFWAQFDRKDQFPNHPGLWMQDYLQFWGMEYKQESLNKIVHQLRWSRWAELNFDPLFKTGKLDIIQPVQINGEPFDPLENLCETLLDKTVKDIHIDGEKDLHKPSKTSLKKKVEYWNKKQKI